MTWQPSTAQRQKYYRDWKSKPGNIEKKRLANKANYDYRKSLGICVRSCCRNDAAPGRATCLEHSKDATRRKREARVA